MNKKSAIQQINRQLEEYRRRFTVESEEYIETEFILHRILGDTKSRADGSQYFGTGKADLARYSVDDLTAALSAVQGKNTAAARAQPYYRALQEAGAPVNAKNTRILAKNLAWIRENKEEIYALLAEEYGDEWQDSDTRKAFENAYFNTPGALYDIIISDTRERVSILGKDPIEFLENIGRIREALELSAENVRMQAIKKREGARYAKATRAEVEKMMKWREKGFV